MFSSSTLFTFLLFNTDVALSRMEVVSFKLEVVEQATNKSMARTNSSWIFIFFLCYTPVTNVIYSVKHYYLCQSSVEQYRDWFYPRCPLNPLKGKSARSRLPKSPGGSTSFRRLGGESEQSKFRTSLYHCSSSVSFEHFPCLHFLKKRRCWNI